MLFNAFHCFQAYKKYLSSMPVFFSIFKPSCTLKSNMFNEQIHRFFFLLGISVIAVSLPLSPFLLSLGQFILAFNWALEFRFKEKLTTLYNRKSILLILSIYLFHVVWLLNTNNMEYALHDLKIKLPLLSLPIIFGTTRALSKKEF